MKLNREEIIKALECCSGTTCKIICPLSNVAEINCGQLLINESLALIKELTEENEKLNEKIRIRDEIIDYRGSEVLRHDKCIRTLHKEIETLKEDTVWKMQEKIRTKSEYGTINISPWQLDQIAKEVLEENQMVEVKHGEWIATRYPEVHRCSICDKPSNTSRGLHAYCPECGAKMDSKKNDYYKKR